MSLIVENLSVARSDRPIFKDLSFSVGSGDILRIEGRNGAGKTSLLRALAGLTTPYDGTIHWQGDNITNDASQLHRDMVYVGHDLALKPGLTVLQNLEFWAGLYGAKKPRDACFTALKRFGMDALFDVPARYLSSGQKRRTSLSRLLVQPRTLWLLDEPSVGLDSASTSKLEIAIQDHRSGGGIVVTSTHTRLTLLKAKILDLDSHKPGIPVAMRPTPTRAATGEDA